MPCSRRWGWPTPGSGCRSISSHRLPAAYRLEEDGLVETEPAGGGFYAGPPPFDVSHAELVSTAADYLRFLRLLVGGGEVDGIRLLSAEHAALMTTDQVPAAAKSPDSFFPGFWDGTGWGFGVGVQVSGPRSGRYGWSGGQGTDFFVDPDGTVGVLLTQVELGERVWPLVAEFQEVGAGSGGAALTPAPDRRTGLTRARRTRRR